jgi:hypothetical protein
MATQIVSQIPGPPAGAYYLVRFSTSFPWNQPGRSPIKFAYQPGVVDRPIGVEIQASSIDSTLHLDCTWEPNPFVFAWYSPRIPLIRPARCHVLVIAIFKRTEAAAEGAPLWLLKQNLTRYGIADHLRKQGLLGADDPARAQAAAAEMLPRSSIRAWKVSAAELDHQLPAAGFAHKSPMRLIGRSKNIGESGYGPGTPGCR